MSVYEPLYELAYSPVDFMSPYMVMAHNVAAKAHS